MEEMRELNSPGSAEIMPTADHNVQLLGPPGENPKSIGKSITFARL